MPARDTCAMLSDCSDCMHYVQSVFERHALCVTVTSTSSLSMKFIVTTQGFLVMSRRHPVQSLHRHLVRVATSDGLGNAGTPAHDTHTALSCMQASVCLPLSDFLCLHSQAAACRTQKVLSACLGTESSADDFSLLCSVPSSLWKLSQLTVTA